MTFTFKTKKIGMFYLQILGAFTSLLFDFNSSGNFTLNFSVFSFLLLIFPTEICVFHVLLGRLISGKKICQIKRKRKFYMKFVIAFFPN